MVVQGRQILVQFGELYCGAWVGSLEGGRVFVLDWITQHWYVDWEWLVLFAEHYVLRRFYFLCHHWV